MRVVLDTNVWVSGLLWVGPPWRVLRLAEQGRIQIVATPAMIDELLGVLEREKFRKRIRELRLGVSRIHEYVLGLVMLVPDPAPAPSGPIVPADPDDDIFLLCAVSVGAGCVISGDHYLLQASGHGGVHVLTAAAFLERCAKT